MEKINGAEFLNEKYRELANDKHVKEFPGRPAQKIAEFLKVLEQTHGHDDPEVLERIKKSYHKEYVIKPEDIPESYFEKQKKILREQGYGDVEITPEMKEQAQEIIIKDQKLSFDNWFDYLCSKDNPYPTWAKYWVFRNVVKLSTFDKEKKVFAKREKNTVAPFPDLDREALAYVVDVITKKMKKEKIPAEENNSEFQKIIQGENFGKLYAYAIEKIIPAEKNDLLTIEGKWVKYPQNPDEKTLNRLVESLENRGTGWCTAAKETARAQLQGGDFYVFYSKDRKGEATIPRLAIRMEGDKIGEIRGIAPDQNLDPYINEVLEKKLKDFPDAPHYKKKVEDMKRMTEIEKKNKRGESFSKEDLRFLYEVDGKIQGFGWEPDPRIQELIKGRNMKQDLAFVFDCSEQEISLTKEEALRGGIKFHYGDLNLNSLTSAQGLELPQSIGGGLYLNSLTSAEGLKLPQSIGGGLDLDSLTSAQGLELPQSIGGSLYLHSLTSAEGLKLPQSIGDYLDLSSLTSAQGLKLPQSIGGSVYLSYHLPIKEQQELIEKYPNLIFYFD